MRTFDYVEEYIEAVTGYIDIVTGKRVSQFYFGISPIINLARYDVSVLESMSDSVLRNQALTEKQGALACKILLNYRRQLANKFIDVTPLENPKWRVALRQMDYSKRLYIQDEKLVLKFPFDNSLIEQVRGFTKESQGEAKWHRENKVWEVALTEFNLSWLYAWCSMNSFEIDQAVVDFMHKIANVEQQGYSIELYVNDGVLDIRNCPDTLRSHIEEHLGGFAMDNVLALVDASAILGYTIDVDLADAVNRAYGHRFYNLATNREVKINPNTLMSTDDFESVIDYAVKCARLPVVVYEPDLSNRMLNRLRELCGPDELLESGNQRNPTITEKTKFIHTYKPLRSMSKIPLIISSAGMVFGGDKQFMVQRAEKVVYCAADVYNKGNNSKKVKKLAG